MSISVDNLRGWSIKSIRQVPPLNIKGMPTLANASNNPNAYTARSKSTGSRLLFFCNSLMCSSAKFSCHNIYLPLCVQNNICFFFDKFSNFFISSSTFRISEHTSFIHDISCKCVFIYVRIFTYANSF